MDTENLQPALIKLLKRAESVAGTKFIISSGFRTPEHNTEVGGVANSAHLTGEAADVACVNSQRRLRILIGAIIAGFTRIGIAKDHIHLDISETKPQDVLFLEYA